MRTTITLFLVLGLLCPVLAGNTYQSKILKSKNTLRKSSNDSSMSSNLYTVMTDSVFPYWMGTKWDFNGISNVPGQGMIACGYFVSTTLKHVGFNLNRYKLAQQAAAKVIHVLCDTNKLYSYSTEAAISQFKTLGNNKLYVLGLDYHVGFIAVENNEVYFIHSDYFNGKVLQEEAKDSEAFKNTSMYVFGEITNNKELLNKWKNGIKIY